MTALPGASGEGFAKIARDLTATKRAQEQREALLQSEQSLRVQLEAANRQKDEFLAVMSHELKNPLNLIALNADLLQRLPETRDACRRWCGSPRRSAASVASQAQIINDLLDLSRMQTGKLSLRRQPVEWGEIVVAHRRCGASRCRAEGGRADAASGSNRPCHVDADPVRLEQIVWNLVSNALKFTPSGGRVELQLDVEGDEARLQVVDSGEGIDPKFMDRLFDMFSQADSGVSRREGGLGIGLALTKRLIDLHGGRLEVESPGRGLGATFTVVLPRLGGSGDARAGSHACGVRRWPDCGCCWPTTSPTRCETFAMLLRARGRARRCSRAAAKRCSN